MNNWTDLKHRAYTPYSAKPKVAICQSDENRYYLGVRIENSAFPETISAVQSAIFNCLSSGKKPVKIMLSDNETEFNDLAFWINEYKLEVSTDNVLNNIEIETPFLKKIFNIKEKLSALESQTLAIHSNFPVMVLLETNLGWVEGVNIECSSWRLGLCAERIALLKAISGGATRFNAIYIMAPKSNYCAPCGACRQVIFEHAPQIQTRLYHGDGTESQMVFQAFLPYSFSFKSLKK